MLEKSGRKETCPASETAPDEERRAARIRADRHGEESLVKYLGEWSVGKQNSMKFNGIDEGFR